MPEFEFRSRFCCRMVVPKCEEAKTSPFRFPSVFHTWLDRSHTTSESRSSCLVFFIFTPKEQYFSLFALWWDFSEISFDLRILGHIISRNIAISKDDDFFRCCGKLCYCCFKNKGETFCSADFEVVWRWNESLYEIIHEVSWKLDQIIRW